MRQSQYTKEVPPNKKYGKLATISGVIRETKLRFARYCCWNKRELISDALLWKPSPGLSRIGCPSMAYTDQPTQDTGGSIYKIP